MTINGSARPEGDDPAAFVYEDDGEPEEAQGYLRRAEAAFLDRDGVVGIGQGVGKTGEETLLVYVVSDEVGKTLPRTFAGRRVVPQVSGVIRAQDAQE
ncbi:MAG: hypothetical protein AAFW97_00870 [Pseudomonadota bacterium]